MQAIAAIGVAVAMSGALAGCGATVSPPASSSSPAASPTPSGGIAHPTGPTDVILRYDEAGSIMGVPLTHGPQFTLFGDGTVVFRDPSVAPAPNVAGVRANPPYLVDRLSAEQMQTLLEFAIGPGAMGIAKPRYASRGADIPWTTITLRAGGLDKQTTFAMIGVDPADPDAPVVAALGELRTRLATFGDESGSRRIWEPDRFRGYVSETIAADGRPWPWPSLTPGDFAGSDPAHRGRALTREEVAPLGLSGVEGGFEGLVLAGPSGGSYTLALRPMLPDEIE